jgi:hypothetical protein
MTAKCAIKLYKLFDQPGIKVWIDGGWGAMLTRPSNSPQLDQLFRQLEQ